MSRVFPLYCSGVRTIHPTFRLFIKEKEILMDLITLESTSTYALQAVYEKFWNYIPQKYRIPTNDSFEADMEAFYDPQLSWDNRLAYDVSKVSYPNRATPWFVITWNTETGLLKSELTRRRFDSGIIELKNGTKVSCKFSNTELMMNICFTTNSMQALIELQECLRLNIREKCNVLTKPHSIIGPFYVSLNVMDTQLNKMEREKGTLAYLLMQCRIDYPIIGFKKEIVSGIIKHINYNNYSLFNDQLLTHDEIVAETDIEEPDTSNTIDLIMQDDKGVNTDTTIRLDF